MEPGDVARLLDERRLWEAAAWLSAQEESAFDEVTAEILRAGDADACMALVGSLVEAAPPPSETDLSVRLSGVDALRHLAVRVAAGSIGDDWEALVPVIQTLAEGHSYRVGESLVKLVSRIASRHFAATRSFWHESLTEDTAELGACVLRGLAASEAPVLEILELFSSVIADIRKDIRNNLGPRAIPELGRRDPQTVYSRLKDWAGRPEEFARWNVAQALATPLGGAYVEDAMELLEYLAADERPAVWRAVAAAVAQIAQRRPAYVLPMLKRWRGERARLRCAELALELLAKR